MSNFQNFVFYGSWREVLEGYKEEFGPEYAHEALWNLMLAATGSEMETTKKSIIGFVNGAVMPNVEAAQERYLRAVEGGKKGGRPKKIGEEDNQNIAMLRREGKTKTQVAELLGVGVATIGRADGWLNYKDYSAASEPHQNSVSKSFDTDTICFDTSGANQNVSKPRIKNQNLDIDIDIDNDTEKDIDTEMPQLVEMYHDLDSAIPMMDDAGADEVSELLDNGLYFSNPEEKLRQMAPAELEKVREFWEKYCG